MTIKDIFGFRVPTPWALKGSVDCANPDLMIGVELEVENCEHGQDWYQDRTGKLGWSTTVDNSLRGTNITTGGNGGIDGAAFEFISKPMRSSTLLFSMEEFFKVTKFDNDNYSDRCSVHVHVNCTDLTPDQLSSVALVYSVVEEILFRFVGNDRENNIYCLPWSQCRMNHDMVDKITQNVDSVSRRWQKYTALNLIPLRTQGTVEFRQMHGTSDMKKLTTWINLIGCIFKYGTNTELTELIKEIKTLNSTSEYEVFFGRVLGNYLPYTDDYRASLEGGILSAKYSLINWKKERKVQREASEPMILDDVEGDDEDAPQAVPTPRAARQYLTEAAQFAVIPPPGEPPANNRFIPWPAIGTQINIVSLTGEERAYITRRGRLWQTTGDGNVTVTGSPLDPVPARPVRRVVQTAPNAWGTLAADVAQQPVATTAARIREALAAARNTRDDAEQQF